MHSIPERALHCRYLRLLLTVLLAVSGWVIPVELRGATSISLSGAWRHWVDADHDQPIEVPFSFPPVKTISAFQKVFTLPVGTPTQRMLLQFDGVVGHAKVYLNGALLGEHGSYTPFEFDVSTQIDAGGENNLIVELDDRVDVTTIPYEDTPWVNYTGIIRDVRLVCADRAILKDSRPQYGLSGDLQHCSGTISVQAFTFAGTTIQFAGAILEPQGSGWSAVTNLSSVSAQAGPDGMALADVSFALDHPTLWSPDSPHLYYLYVVALIAGTSADESMVGTGFRDIRVQGKDILLNGQPLLLKGMSYHGIYPGTGYVGTDAQMTNDLLRIKSTGANYVRTIHYPQHPRLLELADQMGLLISEEVPAWANFWDSDVRARLYAMLGDMIRRDMHHPSVFLWVTGNARAWPMPYALEAGQLCKGLDRNRLVSYVIDNDEYDPVTIAQDVAFVHEAGLDLYMKITWWFYYVEYLQDAWTNFPKDVPIVITEFGREGNDREPIVVDGESLFWFGEDQQADAVTEMLEAWRPHLPQYDAEEHITGLIYFNYQDLDWPDIGRYLPNHIPSVHHGLVYDDRQPKQVLGVLGEFYSGLPEVFVGLPEPQDAMVEQRFDQPAGLDATINTINRDSGPCISGDGTTLYWASDGPDYVGLPRIFFSQWGVDGWSPPAPVDIPQETEGFAFRRAPCISYDGQTLYFTRAIVSGIYVANTRIWSAQRVEGQWSAPQDLGDAINYPDAARISSDPCISPDGDTLYFSSDRPGGLGRTDLWLSRRMNGAWMAPENLGPTVNTDAGESEPSISADGKLLYFSSDRPGGMGSSDIWVAHWVDGDWNVPRNLGPALNSPGADREPEVSKDGRWLFFTGIRSGGVGLSDLWIGQSVFAPADWDEDGDVDQNDFGQLQRCLSGPAAPIGAECRSADLNGDGVVGALDIELLLTCQSGPSIRAALDCGKP